jgi:hypothetical protein
MLDREFGKKWVFAHESLISRVGNTVKRRKESVEGINPLKNSVRFLEQVYGFRTWRRNSSTLYKRGFVVGRIVSNQAN